MAKRVAVITDATDAGYWFPRWHGYYAGCFGADALHVVTYQGKRRSFRNFDLGALWDIPHPYENRLRAEVISSLTDTLLLTHDVVVRCDIDEFLIPDPAVHAGLAVYIDTLDLPSVTARGLEVVERIGEAPLNPANPVLVTQRRYGILSSALNKTSIVTGKTRWAPGFHGASTPPMFNDLYLFHMKFADISGRLAWFRHMLAAIDPASPSTANFADGLQALLDQQRSISDRPIADGWETLRRSPFAAAYAASVTRFEDGIYQGGFFLDDAIFEFPTPFTAIV